MDDLPPPVKVDGNSAVADTASSDDTLFEAKIKNPFSKFFTWLKSLIKNEGINIKIKPLTAIGIAIALTGGGGIVGGIITYFYPYNSPVLHREVIYQGSLQKTEKGFLLTLPNSDLYTLKPKTNSAVNFQNLQSGQALVKGNLTPEKFVIEVSEITLLTSSSSPNLLVSPNPPTSPNTLTIPDSESAQLPKLYPNLQWTSSQKRVLVFTSGKRKIDIEGYHLESSLVNIFPQDFINYYIGELKNNDFKETLNSIDPEGIIITYAKNELFLTFGIKNIYKGSGDKKQVAGFIAFVEHN